MRMLIAYLYLVDGILWLREETVVVA